jgi:hypothetical protein
MSIRKKIVLAALVFLHFLTGCMGVGGVGNSSLTRTPGIPLPRLFVHIKLPLSEDLVSSPVIVIHSGGKIVQVKEPLSGYGLYARWDSNAIGDIAQSNGLKKVYFADVEIFSILGIWRQEKVYIYGE